ncbi:M15 family metallopeptidase [Duganella qianjiadongensis]|uniref:D-alanyl-D-alanine dipeptidase n=1 Tax=Duganella qianjiadongensis TaxID=2692176 RepID=A0ABW9VS60_9BURK|nr:M15 family metallopeptidase [Duganella qianjiadongensis]MYM41469.1 D-alanyl-D-alanine dipeptidase [Duganella qianjiadongensis]
MTIPSASTLPCEAIDGHAAFRHLSSIEGIAVELRYATTDNFVGRDLYNPLDCAWLHRDAAAALEQAVAWLARQRPAYRLLILDALRPQRVQEQLWEALQGTDLLGYIAEPVRGSIHSFGMALDLTIIDEAGRELDMGTAFDDLSERSQPALETVMLELGELTLAQCDNRHLLRNAMLLAGFYGINSEWWHFDCGDRQHVRRTYTRVL